MADGGAPEEGQQNACRLHPPGGEENESLHVVAGDLGRPVERVTGVGEHGGWRRRQRADDDAVAGSCSRRRRMAWAGFDLRRQRVT